MVRHNCYLDLFKFWPHAKTAAGTHCQQSRSQRHNRAVVAQDEAVVYNTG